MSKIDDNFFARADEHINLSNQQLSNTNKNNVSASMMYSAARFNAWVSACESHSGREMALTQEKTIQYFVAEYEKMLRENIGDYIQNFDKYVVREK